jgi:tetratricopeptide (TPR) repeat protein
MDSLYSYYLRTNQTDEAIRVAKAFDLEHPHEFFTSGEIGRLYQQKGNYTESFYYYKKAYEKSRSIDFARKIIIILMKMDKPEECGYYLEIIRKQVHGDKTSTHLMRMIENVIKAKNIVQREPGNFESIKILARYYMYIGNLKMAKIYIDKISEMDPNDPLIFEYLKISKEAGVVNIL